MKEKKCWEFSGIKLMIHSNSIWEIANYTAQLVVTRRNVLSTLSRVFDPLGVISPLVLPSKRCMYNKKSGMNN